MDFTVRRGPLSALRTDRPENRRAINARVGFRLLSVLRPIFRKVQRFGLRKSALISATYEIRTKIGEVQRFGEKRPAIGRSRSFVDWDKRKGLVLDAHIRDAAFEIGTSRPRIA